MADQYAPGGEPVAAVSQIARYRWRIVIRYTSAVPGVDRPLPTSYGPDGYGWIAFGSRAHADRKAARILARFLRRAQYPREEHDVRG